jgi:hypothetical protein
VFQRSRRSRSTIIAMIVILVMFMVFTNPSFLPQFLSTVIPFVDEGAPCERLQTALDRSIHQSWIGRQAQDMLELRVDSSPAPLTDEEALVVRITLVNQSLGTIPVYYDPDEVVIGDDGSNGLSVLFEPSIVPPIGSRPAIASFPASDIILLGPRQRCVHTLRIPRQLLSGTSATVTATYRMTIPGQIEIPAQGFAIFPDQGMNILSGGILRSEPVQIPAPVASAP